jgi:hypothetical protein
MLPCVSDPRSRTDRAWVHQSRAPGPYCLELAPQLRRQAGPRPNPLFGRVGAVITTTLLDDPVSVAVNHIGLRRLEGSTAKVLLDCDPGYRVALPLEARMFLDDGEIHRDEHPHSGKPPVDRPDDIRVRPAGEAEIPYGRDLKTARPETVD